MKLKYRIWDDLNNHWLDFPLVVVNGIGETIWNTKEYDEYVEHECLTVQMFTGLLDSNGKEIYEGDIVKHWVCLGPAGQGEYVSEVKITPWGSTLQKWAYDDRLLPTILGNICENPELLA